MPAETEHIDRIISTKSLYGKGYITVTSDPRPEIRQRIDGLKQQLAALENEHVPVHKWHF
jgi:polyhydroxyalkanoate synthesis regulator phasin